MFSIRYAIVGLGLFAVVSAGAMDNQGENWRNSTFKALCCEFLGKIKGQITGQFTTHIKGYSSDSFTLQGGGRFQGDWILVPTDAKSVVLTLIPDEKADWVYFSNIFDRPLYFDIDFGIDENMLDQNLKACLSHFSSEIIEKDKASVWRYELKSDQFILFPRDFFRGKQLILTMAHE